jgi:hypothetical protein
LRPGVIDARARYWAAAQRLRNTDLGFQIVVPNALSIVVNEGESKYCVLKMGLAQL